MNIFVASVKLSSHSVVPLLVAKNVEVPVEDCFPELINLKKSLSRAKEALESEPNDVKSVREVAKSLGCRAAKDGQSIACNRRYRLTSLSRIYRKRRDSPVSSRPC